MNTGSFELKIFAGLIVVLAAAFVVLICDYLKGNNEQLRMRNRELQARGGGRASCDRKIHRGTRIEQQPLSLSFRWARKLWKTMPSWEARKLKKVVRADAVP